MERTRAQWKQTTEFSEILALELTNMLNYLTFAEIEEVSNFV